MIPFPRAVFPTIVSVVTRRPYLQTKRSTSVPNKLASISGETAGSVELMETEPRAVGRRATLTVVKYVLLVGREMS